MRTICFGVLCLSISVTANAQIPGQNVNMVTGKTFPNGDPWLQKQNEPSGAVSTVNPCRLLAGANDYRAVNVPGLPADKENGDAWVGWYTSINCGQTWYSTLLPGYLQDTSAAGKGSPVYGLTTAADPTVRAGAGGFFAYSFIAYNRGSNVGKVAVARFLDRNTNETVKQPESAISYIDTKVWDNGSAGNFIDKPTLTVTQGAGTCSVTTASGKTRTIPASTVHLAWTVFVGNSDQVIRTKVYYARSSNCGASLDGPATKLSEGYAITQSASVAVAPNGAIYVVWRQFSTLKGDQNQLLVAKSIDGGKSFTKGATVPMSAFLPIDQGTSSKTFRTNTFPSTATDQWGRLYVAFAARGYAYGDQSRIVVMNTADGVVWNPPMAIDNYPDDSGHQIMPAITAADGKLNAVWLDFHDDVSARPPFNYGLFQFFIKEIYPVRHTMDVRGAQATLQQSGTLSWTKYGILQDAEPKATLPRISKYFIGDYQDLNGDTHLRQLQFNRAVLKLYAGGTRPFIGDFIDVAGLVYLAQQNGQTTTWVPNNGTIAELKTTAAQTFYAFWTDNRDAKVGKFKEEPAAENEEGALLPYMAPGTGACTGTNPPTKTRNANVYMSRITPGVFVAAPTNSKPSIRGNVSTNRIVRTFPVLVQNNTGGLPKTFTLTIVPPANFPASGIATFGLIKQSDIDPGPLPAPILTLSVTIPPKSSITRTVSVYSSIKYPQIRVIVTENTATDPLTGSTIINADIENADIENADIENADIENQELHNADIENADIENADIENADIENADIENADIENADIENADIENADIENADIENADIENADIENADIENGAMTDFSVDLDNTGNTSSSYQVKFAVGGNTGGYIFQLIGRRPYKTPSAHGCDQIEKTTNQILFNIIHPDILPTQPPDPTSPAAGDVSNATILVGPREKLKVTLRAFDKDGVKINGQPKFTGGDGSVKPFCPIIDMNGANCSVVTNPITVLVRAAAPNTGSNVAFEEIVTTNPAGAVSITTTTLPNGYTDVLYAGNGLTLQAAGGLGSSLYQWSATTSLPPGLTFSPAGVLSGTPTSFGTFNVGFRVTDGVQSATKTMTLVIIKVTLSFQATGQPTAAAVDEALFPALRVQAVDQIGNPMQNVQVTLSVAQGTASALYGDTTALTDQSGVATFKNTRLSTANTYQLLASTPVSPSVTSQSFAVSAMFKTITDPAGDQLGGGTNPDLVQADAIRNGNAITFNVSFAAATFDPATSWATIYLDLDHDIFTGSPGVTSGCTLDANTIGADYFIAVGAQFTPAQVYRVTYPPCASWTLLGTVAIVSVTNGYQVTVPLSMIGNDDGGLNFKVAAARFLGNNSSTGLLDTMPDVGLAAGLLDNTAIVAAMSTRDLSTGPGLLIGGTTIIQKLAQVFQTTYAGTLTEVRVPVSCSSGTLDLEIQGVNGNGLPDGTVLASQSFPTALDSPPAGVFTRLVLASPLAVSQGTKYAFVLKSGGFCQINNGPVADLYTGGDGFYDVSSNPPGWLTLTFGNGGRADLPFQVLVSQPPIILTLDNAGTFQADPSFNETRAAEVTVTSANKASSRR